MAAVRSNTSREVLGSPQRADCCRHCCCCCSSSWATSRSFLLQACTPGFAATPLRPCSTWPTGTSSLRGPTILPKQARPHRSSIRGLSQSKNSSIWSGQSSSFLFFEHGSPFDSCSSSSVVGALGSAVVMALLYSPAAENRLYYGTDARAQSLLIGAALSVGLTLAATRRSQPGIVTSTPSAWQARNTTARRAYIVVGFAGILATTALWTLVTVDDAFAFRGGFILAAVSTACVLASVVGAPGSVLATVLAFGPLRYLGRISYGMYLWHFPLFLWLTASNTGLVGVPLFVLRCACTVVIASVSYYALEQPIRQRRFLRRSWKEWVAAPTSILAVVAVVLAATPVTVTAAPSNFRPPARKTGPLYAGPPVKLLLVGDSTAYTLGLGLSAYQREYDIKMKNSGILGCGVTDGAEFELQGVVSQMTSYCSGTGGAESWNQVWQHQLSTFDPNVVMILAGRWEVTNRTYEGGWTNIMQPQYAGYVKRQLKSAVRLAGSRWREGDPAHRSLLQHRRATGWTGMARGFPTAARQVQLHCPPGRINRAEHHRHQIYGPQLSIGALSESYRRRGRTLRRRAFHNSGRRCFRIRTVSPGGKARTRRDGVAVTKLTTAPLHFGVVQPIAQGVFWITRVLSQSVPNSWFRAMELPGPPQSQS